VIGHRFRARFDTYDAPLEHVVANALRMARKHFDEPTWDAWLARFRVQTGLTSGRLPGPCSNRAATTSNGSVTTSWPIEFVTNTGMPIGSESRSCLSRPRRRHKTRRPSRLRPLAP